MNTSILKKVSLVMLLLVVTVACVNPIRTMPNSPFSYAETTADELVFTILYTADEHGALIPSPLVDSHPNLENPSVGGFARLAQLISEIRREKAAQNEPVLLVSAGDYIGGSPFSWLALDGQAPELSLMLKMGYDVITIGNHEYDYGPDLLAEYLRAAGYPAANHTTRLVASNTIPPVGHPLNYVGIQKTHIQKLSNDITVGFLGLMGLDAVNKAPYAEPVTFSDQFEAAKEAVAELQAQGADIIIAITHADDGEDLELAKQVEGIDIIVGGHSHITLEEPLYESNTLIVKSGAYLHNLGVLEVAYDPATGNIRARNGATGQPLLVALDSSIAEEPTIASEVQRYTTALNQYIHRITGGQFSDIAQIIAYTDFEVSNGPSFAETPMGNLVTDAMRIIGTEVTGRKVDFSIQADGVIRGGIVPGSMPFSTGQMSFYDVVSLVGLGKGPDMEAGYPLVSIYLTGDEMRRVMEISILLSELMGSANFLQYSGLNATYDPSRAILFTVPIRNLPIPTTRAILTAERHVTFDSQTGEVLQKEPLKKGDETLYHVITDYYLVAFLPMVGELLPSLGLEIKDEEGNLATAEERIVYYNGQEFKVWQAVMSYIDAFPLGPNGKPQIPDRYATTSGRLVQKKATIPLLVWPSMALLLLVGGGALGIKKIRSKRQARQHQLHSRRQF